MTPPDVVVGEEEKNSRYLCKPNAFSTHGMWQYLQHIPLSDKTEMSAKTTGEANLLIRGGQTSDFSKVFKMDDTCTF